jgi:hypothetical protein
LNRSRINTQCPVKSTFGRKWTGLVLVFVLALPIPVAMAQEKLPAGARPLTAVELYRLVRNKTWKWDTGAGRYFGKDRQFLAWSDGKDGPSYANGRYEVTNRGRLCLVADWHSAAGTTNDRTCFMNKEANGVIYQRREGSEDWYVFSHTPPEPSDEYAKFVPEDLVSDRLAEIRAELQSISPPKKGKNDE